MLEVAKRFLIGCAKFLGRGMKMCTCFDKFMRAYAITARIVFYPNLKDKSFAFVVGEGLVENCVGAFLFPLALPVSVCERESCYGEQRLGRTLIFAHKTIILFLLILSLFWNIYTYVYIYMKYMYLHAVTHIHAHKAALEKGISDLSPCKTTGF